MQQGIRTLKQKCSTAMITLCPQQVCIPRTICQMCSAHKIALQKTC